MTLAEYIAKHQTLPPIVLEHMERAHSVVMPTMGFKRPWIIPKVKLSRSLITLRQGIWVPDGVMRAARWALKAGEFLSPHTPRAIAQWMHEWRHVWHHKDQGAGNLFIAGSWAWLTGKTWHHAAFEQEAIQFEKRVYKAINSDPEWKNQLYVDVFHRMEQESW